MAKNKKQICLWIFAAISSLVALGGIVGCIVLGTQKHPCNCPHAEADPYRTPVLMQNLAQLDEITKFVDTNVNVTNIREHLLVLTKNYHPAGTAANREALDYVKTTWKSYGLDVQEDEYEVLLSYPDYENPNTLDVLENAGWTRISNGTGEPLGSPDDLSQQNDTQALVWWNAFAKSGNVTGRLVYVNYCREKDFASVANSKVDVSGAIVLCRYGYGWRGSKVYQAEARGAIGVVLYTDPEEYGPPEEHSFRNITIPGYPSDFVYPKSVYMPPVDTQRGTLLQLNEDPETPIYPAKPYTYRWYNESELRDKHFIPNIPVTPISYGDAERIFIAMGNNNGKPVNPLRNVRFHGNLNVTYFLTSDSTFNLNVRTNVTRRPIKNVIAYLRGKDEPDRYVLLGNHVDAWTYGAQDPNSGTAVNLETARVLMAACNATGWRPKRTIVFCGWDAEEYSLFGSTEWAEEKLKILESRLVAVLNVDISVMGNQTLWVQAVPLVYRAVMEAAKRVANPNTDEVNAKRITVFDSWSYYSNASYLQYDPADPVYMKDDLSVPYMPVPAADSDQFAFLNYIGVPIVNFGYHTAYYTGSYPLYHSSYETEWTFEHLVDGNFQTAGAMVKLWAEMAKNLADSLVIPFNVTDYGSMMIGYVSSLNRTLFEDRQLIDNYDFVINSLTDAALRFLNSTLDFQKRIDFANSGDVKMSIAEVEILNSRLQRLENAFIDPRGLPERPVVRHVIFAPSVSNEYSGVVCSGVTDSLSKFKSSQTDDWRKMTNLQLTVVQYSIESAIQLLTLPLENK